jgi:hypothetical protein
VYKGENTQGEIQDAIKFAKDQETHGIDPSKLADSNEPRVLLLKDFMREYKSLKQKYNKKMNLKIWDTSNQHKKGKANFYFSSQKATNATGAKEGDKSAANDEGNIP